MTRGAYLGMLAIAAVMVLGLSLMYGPVDGEVDRSGRMLWRLPFADGPWSYWWHHAFVVIPVAALSFEHRIRYFSRWKQVLLASLAPAAIYITWDILFTANGIWDFDDAKTAGQRLLGLPVEEWLWFFTIPFAVIFIHENLRYYMPVDKLLPCESYFAKVLVVGLAAAAVWNYDRLYTVLALGSAAALLLADLRWGDAATRSRFLGMFVVSLVPMLIFNGWLTGMFSTTPLVSYHAGSHLGLWIGTMPFEDMWFGLGYLLLVFRGYQQIIDKNPA